MPDIEAINETPCANLSFLVVEDHVSQRSAMIRTLERLGATVVRQARDGQSALKILEDPALMVDVIISDLEMPGMDGMEFFRRLGETGNGISIIIASALEKRLVASIETMSEAYGIALLGVMEKPMTPGKLLPLIVRHRSTRGPAARPFRPEFVLAEIVEGLNNGEFEPFFQPKVELATGEVRGVEALARWRHPQHGIVGPSAFVKLLEEGDLIDELLWVMLRKAAVSCGTWRASGVDATVAVNISVRSLGDVKLADRVTDLVRSVDLEPRHMVLEVTESAATTDVGRALENLARLRMKGFGLSIDDYGTGYSSMEQLTRIAFTELKIDQSFVFKAGKQKSAQVILESSLDMARKLGITSVAEGVETRVAFELLRALGCDLAQGYFVARPMEGDSLLGWVQDWIQPEDEQESFATGSRRRDIARRM